METVFTWLATNFGLTGLTIFGLGFYIIFKEKRHGDERKTWQGDSMRAAEQTSMVIAENTGVLRSLQSLIESMDRRMNGR